MVIVLLKSNIVITIFKIIRYYYAVRNNRCLLVIIILALSENTTKVIRIWRRNSTGKNTICNNGWVVSCIAILNKAKNPTNTVEPITPSRFQNDFGICK